MRPVDLAVYADAVAGEAAALAARAERLRSKLRQSAIERRARDELQPETVIRLEELGVLARANEKATRAELRELERSLEAIEELQAWVERELAASAA
jgi:hypothetical protein